MSIRIAGTALLCCLGLAACNNMNPPGATSAAPVGAPSGVNASNGGGQRQLGNLPSVGITNGGVTQSNVPNRAGNSY